MKVCIYGSREFIWEGLVEEAMASFISQHGPVTEVVCGCAKGADTLGLRWGVNNNIPIKRFPAKWDVLDAPGAVLRTKFGREFNARAGADRNTLMAEYSDFGVGFIIYKSRGSSHMTSELARLNKGAIVYHLVLDAIPGSKDQRFRVADIDNYQPSAST